MYVVIGALVVSLGASFIFRIPQKKSTEKYRAGMRELLGELGINELANRQQEFIQGYYARLNPPAEETNNEVEKVESVTTNESDVTDDKYLANQEENKEEENGK